MIGPARIALGPVAALALAAPAIANPAASPKPADVVRTAIAALEAGDLPTLNRIFAPEGPWHLPGGAQKPQGGPYTDLAQSCPMCARLSDRHIAIEVMVAEGDLVSVRTRWSGRYSGTIQGATVTDRPVVLTYQNIYRVAGGRIVENWADYNGMDLARQLGFTVVPPPPAPRP